MDNTDLLQELREFIDDFMEDTGLGRHEFVIVCNPGCPLIQKPGGGTYDMLDGVWIVTHEDMYINGLSLFPHDELDELEEIIRELDLDKPGSGVGALDVLKDEKLYCNGCGHPISAALIAHGFFATCPWCYKVNKA